MRIGGPTVGIETLGLKRGQWVIANRGKFPNENLRREVNEFLETIEL